MKQCVQSYIHANTAYSCLFQLTSNRYQSTKPGMIRVNWKAKNGEIITTMGKIGSNLLSVARANGIDVS